MPGETLLDAMPDILAGTEDGMRGTPAGNWLDG
jgi:hypothetical protein